MSFISSLYQIKSDISSEEDDGQVVVDEVILPDFVPFVASYRKQKMRKEVKQENHFYLLGVKNSEMNI